MPTITQGVTFSPKACGNNLDDGFQARVHDPLWLLARQWQFGEFLGEDAGSAARVRIDSEQLPLTRYRAGSGQATGYTATDTPLEALVEREALGAVATRSLQLVADAGLHFLRLLVVNGASAHQGAYRTRYKYEPLPASEVDDWDADSLALRRLLTGRGLDGARLYADLAAALGANGTGTGPLPPLPVIPAADESKVRTAARTWLQWVVAQDFSVPTNASAWDPERMEYRFSVAARNSTHEAILLAPEYLGGRLDWDTFVAHSGSTLGGTPLVRTSTQNLLPTPVAYHGMPYARLWAFEDGRVNLGAVDGGNPDLAVLVLLDFALVYGNDWFLAPLQIEVGALSRVTALVVRDSFGNDQSILHYRQVDGAAGAWRMFAITPQEAAADTDLIRRSMLLAPVVGATLEESPTEDVLFLRDEMANTAWAVERVVPGRAGRPLDRYEQTHRDDSAPGEGEAGGIVLADLRYRLGTSVPEYWIPFLPQQENVAGRLILRLRRAGMPRGGPADEIVEPIGTLLQPGQPLTLYGEEVPREGVRVTRAAQHTRWINGQTVLWMGARKIPGRGGGSSGLRFDSIKET
jgi:hypothetical protein